MVLYQPQDRIADDADNGCDPNLLPKRMKPKGPQDGNGQHVHDRVNHETRSNAPGLEQTSHIDILPDTVACGFVCDSAPGGMQARRCRKS